MQLQKLDAPACPCKRTESSEDPKIALRLSDRVAAARARMYHFHMLQSWTPFPQLLHPRLDHDDSKSQFWATPHVGLNSDEGCDSDALSTLFHHKASLEATMATTPTFLGECIEERIARGRNGEGPTQCHRRRWPPLCADVLKVWSLLASMSGSTAWWVMTSSTSHAPMTKSFSPKR